MLNQQEQQILQDITHVIAITGPKGGGKSTFAKRLQDVLVRIKPPLGSVFCMGFAYQLKAEIINVLFGELFGDPETYFSQDLKNYYPPIRRLLQDWGDWRKSQDPLYWCKALAQSMIDTVGNTEEGSKIIWIIPDLRFPEELYFLQMIFGKRLTTFTVIPHEDKIDRKDHHNSELYWDKMKTDFTIPNLGSVEQLKASAELYIKDTYGDK